MPILAMGRFHLAGINAQQMADGTVSENRRCQKNEPDQAQQVGREIEEEQEGKNYQA